MRSLTKLALAAAVLVAPLAACGNPEYEAHSSPKWARADRATVMHGVVFPPSRQELSAVERQRLAEFVKDLHPDRTTVMLLTSNDSGPLQAQRAAIVRQHLQAMGVQAAPGTQAHAVVVGSDTIVVSAETYSARALNCPDWSKVGGVYDPLNQTHSNLGCANARNLADMIANPRDIAVGRSSGPGSGHLGATAVDRLYNDKVKAPPSATGGGGAGAGAGAGQAPPPT